MAVECKNVLCVTLGPSSDAWDGKMYVGIGVQRLNAVLKLHSAPACFTTSWEDLKGLLDQFF